MRDNTDLEDGNVRNIISEVGTYSVEYRYGRPNNGAQKRLHWFKEYIHSYTREQIDHFGLRIKKNTLVPPKKIALI